MFVHRSLNRSQTHYGVHVMACHGIPWHGMACRGMLWTAWTTMGGNGRQCPPTNDEEGLHENTPKVPAARGAKGLCRMNLRKLYCLLQGINSSPIGINISPLIARAIGYIYYQTNKYIYIYIYICTYMCIYIEREGE